MSDNKAKIGAIFDNIHEKYERKNKLKEKLQDLQKELDQLTKEISDLYSEIHEICEHKYVKDTYGEHICANCGDVQN